MTRPRPLGGSGTPVFDGRVHDTELNPDLRDRRWVGDAYTLGIGRWMLTDAHCRQACGAISDPVLGADWDFEPGADDDVAKEAADFQRHLWFERTPWQTTLRHALGYVPDGFSLLETTDDVGKISTSRFPRHPGKGAAIVLTGVHHRPAWTIERWIQSKADSAKLAGVEQMLPGSDAEATARPLIPIDRLIRFTWDQVGADFDGLPILRSAYGPFKGKVTLTLIELIRHEREHVGTPTMKLPPGQAEDLRKEAERILSELRAHEKAYLILPDGWSFEWSTTKTSTDIHLTIERFNRDIAFVVGAAWMLTGTSSSGSGGSHALTSNQRVIYEIGLEKHGRFIEDAFNVGQDGVSQIRRLHELNYGPGVAQPRLVARAMPTRDWRSVFENLYKLSTAGLITGDDQTEALLRRVMRINQHDRATARPRASTAVASASDQSALKEAA